MKLAFIIFGIVLIGCSASRDVFSPMDEPHYQEVVKTLTKSSETADRNRTATGKITNGTPAQLGQFPYQVYLYILYAIGTKLCGGSVSASKL